MDSQFISLYGAFNARDIPAVMEHLADDVVWANGMEGGFVQGKPAIADYWRRQWSQIDPEVTPQGVSVDAEGRVIVRVRQKVRDLDGQVLMDHEVRHIFTLRHGLIARFDIGC